MPKIKPNQAESYLCTPIRMDTDATYYIVGFKPNATKMTAHHMLIYGCDEPGKSTYLFMSSYCDRFQTFNKNGVLSLESSSYENRDVFWSFSHWQLAISN